MYTSALPNNEKIESQYSNWSIVYCKYIIQIIRQKSAIHLLTKYFGENWEEKVIFLYIIHCN